MGYNNKLQSYNKCKCVYYLYPSQTFLLPMFELQVIVPQEKYNFPSCPAQRKHRHGKTLTHTSGLILHVTDMHSLKQKQDKRRKRRKRDTNYLF